MSNADVGYATQFENTIPVPKRMSSSSVIFDCLNRSGGGAYVEKDGG